MNRLIRSGHLGQTQMLRIRIRSDLHNLSDPLHPGPADPDPDPNQEPNVFTIFRKISFPQKHFNTLSRTMTHTDTVYDAVEKKRR